MSPWVVRNLLFPLHERLLGKRTRLFLRELEASQSWPIEKLRELQMRKLAALVAYAQSKVPYFGKLFAEYGIRATAIQDFEDFHRIPLMTRQTIREHLDDLMPTGYRGRIVPVATGGSTGEPLQLYNDMVRIARCDAARHRVYRWYGVNIGDREVALWGSPADLSKMDRLRLVRDRLLNTRLLRAFGLDEPTMDRYIDIFRSYRPRKVYAYVSCAYVMALHMLHVKARLPEPPAVMIVTAEPLYDFQRKAIEEAFQTRVSVEYGCRDGGLIAGQCPSGGIHLNAELNYVELGPAGTPRTPDGASIAIEERSAREVTHLAGRAADGRVVEVQLVPDGTPAANPAFDVTPAALDAVTMADAVLAVPLSVARAHSRRDMVHRPVTDAPATTVALVWRTDADNPWIDEFIGIVRGRTANSSRTVRERSEAGDGASRVRGAASGGRPRRPQASGGKGPSRARRGRGR